MGKPQLSGFFALCCYVLGVLTYVVILQRQGEGSVHMWENRPSEQGSCLDFSSSTRLMSGFFPPVFFFPTDEHCCQQMLKDCIPVSNWHGNSIRTKLKSIDLTTY